MSEKHSGFTLIGNIDGDSSSYKAENMDDPSNDQDYVTKKYMDDNTPQSDNYSNYTGSDCSGANGAPNRKLNHGSSATMVFVDGMFLHPEIQFTQSDGEITFKPPIYDTQKITIW